MIKVSGLEALNEIKAFNPVIPVIIMAYSSVDTAVEALNNGAYDYLTKPLDFDVLRLTMEGAMDRLLKHDWSGNARELMNAVERSVVLSQSEYLGEEDLPLIPRNVSPEGEILTNDVTSADLPLDEVEKATILKTMELTEGNKSEAARRLGITRRTLHKKLKKYGVM